STGGLAAALIVNTSSSGSENLTAAFQFRPSSSSHAPLGGVAGLNFTMRPVSACGSPLQLLGFGAGGPPGDWPPLQAPAPAPPLHTTPSLSAVVSFPESKTAA